MPRVHYAYRTTLTMSGDLRLIMMTVCITVRSDVIHIVVRSSVVEPYEYQPSIGYKLSAGNGVITNINHRLDTD